MRSNRRKLSIICPKILPQVLLMRLHREDANISPTLTCASLVSSEPCSHKLSTTCSVPCPHSSKLINFHQQEVKITRAEKLILRRAKVSPFLSFGDFKFYYSFNLLYYNTTTTRELYSLCRHIFLISLLVQASLCFGCSDQARSHKKNSRNV